MTAPSNYFYDGQIRRFISQFIRIVSNFYVEFGKDSTGVVNYQRVPVIYGDQSRQAAQIIRNNSAATLSTVPAMAVYVNALAYDRERVQDPTLVQNLQFRQREFDPVTGTYTHNQGEAYTVERLMPVPYKLTLKLDIWTSNTEQKLQLIEQLSAMFNPSIEMQSTDNYIDWTSLTVATLTDVNWSSRTVPTGGEEPIDIASMTFELPIWISTSIKVKRLGVIHSIVNNIQDLNDFNVLDKKYVSFGNYGVLLHSDNSGHILRLIKQTDIVANDIPNQTHAWQPVLEQYGAFRPGISEIRLMQSNGSEIVGTVAVHPSDPTILLYTPFGDTIPTNNMAPINAIINPQNVNVDSYLLHPANGTRYLLTEEIGQANNLYGAVAWRGADNQDLIANDGDIVEFNGTHWSVVFDSRNSNTLHYLTNLSTGIQYKRENDQWIKSYDGIYPAGLWGLVI